MCPIPNHDAGARAMTRTMPKALNIAALRSFYADGDPVALVEDIEARITAWADPALFIVRPAAAAIRARAALLGSLGPDKRNALPLFGIPFVVKDNIDVAGLPTTAACPEFVYTPARSATVVERLEAAGAILIGKTNLDQFATGLVGVRSPYGVPRNPFDANVIPGGSSSGSATAVAAGLAAFSLGTDTAGSGRIPAGLNNLVGLKPTPGLVPATGVVPACRTLDCVSVFAMTADDAFDVLSVIAGFDAADAYSQRMPLGALGERSASLRLGVPRPDALHFFGDAQAEAGFKRSLGRLQAPGIVHVDVDFGPLFAVARMLYEGPWTAERYIAAADLLETKPEAVLPVIRTIVGAAKSKSAVDTFRAQYALKAAVRATEALWTQVDALVVPTVPRAWTIAEMAADPISNNASLGTYTNFVNLLGMCALAVPQGLRDDGLPHGVTLIAPGGRDAWLSSVGRWVETCGDTPLGASQQARPSPRALAPTAPESFEPIAVFGAHMSGLPLNRDLLAFGGVFVEAVVTAPIYRFHALAGGPPHRPGLVQVVSDGAAIDAEIWALPAAGLGGLLVSVPPPLCIGTITLADGRRVKGFLCESAGLAGATDITYLGGWRKYLATKSA
jgi:allophanate hydrolase